MAASCGSDSAEVLGPSAADEIGTPGVIDLVAELRHAHIDVATSRIRMGSAESHEHVRGGWSEDGPSHTSSHAWAIGETQRLVIGLASSRAFALSFRALPYSFESAPEQSVNVLLNGTEIGRVVLATDRESDGEIQKYSISVPEGVGHPGANWIEIRHAWWERPVDVAKGAIDTRQLASLWTEVWVEGAPEVEGPEVFKQGDSASLVIPVGAQLQYFFPLGEGATLKLDGLREGQRRTENGLRVLVETDGDGVLVDELWEVDKRAHALTIPAHTDPRAQLTLRPVPLDGDFVGAGAIEVKGPRLYAGVQPKAKRSYLGLPESRVKRPNVLIYLIDTLRADHMSAYGYDKLTTPNIEAFAERGVVFENAHANSSWTRASTASLFTGMNARHHGVEDRLEILGEEALTLAEGFKSAGYRTGMFFTNSNIGGEFGFFQGFDYKEHFGEDLESPEVYASAARAQSAALTWIEEDDDRPWFAYVHVTDPHGPYSPTPRFAEALTDGDYPAEMTTLDYLYSMSKAGRTLEGEDLEDIISLYDAEIAQIDNSFGELLSALETRSDFDQTLACLTADHGEEFLDHGWWQHGKTVFAEQLDVPLIMRFPNDWSAGTRVEHATQLIDIFPTLGDWLDILVPEQIDGVSLLTPNEERAPPPLGLDAIAGSIHLDTRISRSVVLDGWKLVDVISLQHPGSEYFHVAMPAPYAQRFPYTPYPLLFNVAEDPREQENLAQEHPVLVAYLRALIGRVPLAESKAREELDPELDAKLRALGY